MFVLGANLTQPQFEAFTTPAPTSVPTPSPTPSPTHIPTPLPTYVPTSVPTSKPTYSPTPLPTYLPTSHPSLVPTSIPTPLPTFVPSFLPTTRPTYVPTSLPTMKPTSVPTLSPTFKPTTSPTLSPTTSPTSLPTNHPTLPPTTSPTLVPTPLPTTRPTLSPTLHPTTSDTASVAVEFAVTAAGPATDSDKTALQSTIASETGLTTSAIKNLVITSASTRRLTDSDMGKARRRLTTYTWTVSFDIEADLSVIGESSPASFASSVNTQLSDSSFVTALDSALPTSVTGVSSVSTVENTRNPSMAPTASPSQPPTPVPNSIPNKSNNNNDTASSALIISLIVVGCVLFVLFVMVIHRVYFVNAQVASGKVVPIGSANPSVDRPLSPPRRANAYVGGGAGYNNASLPPDPPPLTEADLEGILGQRQTAEL
jgi:hypothetical protein